MEDNLLNLFRQSVSDHWSLGQCLSVRESVVEAPGRTAPGHVLRPLLIGARIHPKRRSRNLSCRVPGSVFTRSRLAGVKRKET